MTKSSERGEFLHGENEANKEKYSAGAGCFYKTSKKEGRVKSGDTKYFYHRSPEF